MNKSTKGFVWCILAKFAKALRTTLGLSFHPPTREMEGFHQPSHAHSGLTNGLARNRNPILRLVISRVLSTKSENKFLYQMVRDGKGRL
jgi:hypothetical protein